MAESGNSSNWAAAGTGATGIGQLAYGAYLNKKNKRPRYTIPDEIRQNLSHAQLMALEGLPDEQKQQFIKNIERGSTFSMNQLGTRKAGLAGLASVNQQQQDAYGNLLSMDAQARQQNQQNLINQRQVMADYRDQAFQLNKLNPYYEKTAQSQAMMGAGMQNISNAGQMFNYNSNKGQSSNTNPNTSSNTEAEYTQSNMNDINGVDYSSKSKNRNGMRSNYYYGTDAYDPEQYPFGGTVGDGATGVEDERAADYATEDATFNTVGQMGAVGKVIQGVTAIGNAVGRPVRDKNEAVDPNTGELKNYKSHLTIGGGMLNPLTALQTRSKYKGGFTDIDGSGYKNYLQDNAKAAWKLDEQDRNEAKQSATTNVYNNMLAKNQLQSTQYPFGGVNNSNRVIEIEKKEVVKTPDNSVYVANAPSHEDGGMKIITPKGSDIFSDRIKVPGTKITFAEKAKHLKGKDLDNLFSVQEAYKKSNGL